MLYFVGYARKESETKARVYSCADGCVSDLSLDKLYEYTRLNRVRNAKMSEGGVFEVSGCEEKYPSIDYDSGYVWYGGVVVDDSSVEDGESVYHVVDITGGESDMRAYELRDFTKSGLLGNATVEGDTVTVASFNPDRVREVYDMRDKVLDIYLSRLRAVKTFFEACDALKTEQYELDDEEIERYSEELKRRAEYFIDESLGSSVVRRGIAASQGKNLLKQEDDDA